jgi:hypothetical protein
VSGLVPNLDVSSFGPGYRGSNVDLCVSALARNDGIAGPRGSWRRYPDTGRSAVDQRERDEGPYYRNGKAQRKGAPRSRSLPPIARRPQSLHRIRALRSTVAELLKPAPKIFIHLRSPP